MRTDSVAELDRIGRRQHGLITRQQAAEVLGTSRTKRWVGDGRLAWVQPRVLRIVGAPRSPHQAMLAASLSASGPVSHRSAAWLWGLVDALPDQVDVSVRYPRSATLRDPARVHRIRDLAPSHHLRRQDIDLTNPMRTIVDLGLVERWTVVDAALGRAIASRLVPLSAVVALREELARRGRNGTGVVQRVFDERLLRGADEDSALEVRLIRLARRFGLPPLVLQHEVWHEGRFVARLDAAYPERLVAIEVDGYQFHSDPAAFQRDRERQNALVQLGWVVLRFTWFDVIRRAEHVAAAIHSVL